MVWYYDVAFRFEFGLIFRYSSDSLSSIRALLSSPQPLMLGDVHALQGVIDTLQVSGLFGVRRYVLAECPSPYDRTVAFRNTTLLSVRKRHARRSASELWLRERVNSSAQRLDTLRWFLVDHCCGDTTLWFLRNQHWRLREVERGRRHALDVAASPARSPCRTRFALHATLWPITLPHPYRIGSTLTLNPDKDGGVSWISGLHGGGIIGMHMLNRFSRHGNGCGSCCEQSQMYKQLMLLDTRALAIIDDNTAFWD